MNDSLADEVIDYLTSRRTASVGNIALRCRCGMEALLPVIATLESEGRLRRAFSRCQSGCDSCAGCDTDPASLPVSDRTILISLEPSAESS